MLLHKGNKYEITTSGENAIKSDGNNIRRMRFYPERDAYNISGEIDELTAWLILRDISGQAQHLGTPISPDHILISREGFHLAEWSESMDRKFIAPEGYSHVWALGASVFRIFLGCDVFQGLGGKGQTKSSPVPSLRRELPELSSIISLCLGFDPLQRPLLEEIKSISDKNIQRCLARHDDFPPLKPAEIIPVSLDDIDKYWPEEMY